MTPFLVIAALLLLSAAAAMTLRNLIHSALLLVVSWFAAAALYLWADAQFVAFAQILVYAGAISMVALFAVLLTRRAGVTLHVQRSSIGRAAIALLTGAGVATAVVLAILETHFAPPLAQAPATTVKDLGLHLMGPQAAAVLIAGALLTVTLIGAVVIAAVPSKSGPEDLP